MYFMFRNRGGTPNINPGGNKGNGGRGGYRAPHYSHYWNGRFIIIRYDMTFVKISIIISLLVLIIAACALVFGYKLPFEDPIGELKNNFLTAQLITLIASIGLVILAVYFTKSSKEHLIRYLRIIALLSFISIIVFFGVKINLDNEYNETTFASFYDEDESEDTYSQTLSFGLSGLKISTPKQVYVDQNMDAYTYFTIKNILYMVLQLVITILIFYFSIRLTNIENKKDKLSKDDKILFDDVQNVKY